MHRLLPFVLVFAAACAAPKPATDSAAPPAASAEEPHDMAGSMHTEHAADRPTPSGAVQPPRVPVVGETVNYIGSRGYYARPRSRPTRAGLIVAHEWWGLNDNVRRMADRLAGEGYRVLAIDLYAGMVATRPDSAAGLYRAATTDLGGMRDNLQRAYRWLTGPQGGATGKVGVLGWCMGGLVAIEGAMTLPTQLDAAVIYYGDMSGATVERLRPIRMPILGHFAEQDRAIPPDSVAAFEQRLAAAGRPADLTVYPGVGHGFANPTGQRYDAAAEAEAWTKTVAFLRQNLLPTPARTTRPRTTRPRTTRPRARRN